MNRNPIIPFVLIMAIGVIAMFLMSFKGLDDMEKIAAQQENGEEQAVEESADANSPDGLYASSCAGCHAVDGTGGVGPSLVNTSLSQEEIVEILVNGKGSMPGGLVFGNEEAVAQYILETFK